MKRPNQYSRPLGGDRKENYHPSETSNNQYADDLNKYIDYLESKFNSDGLDEVVGRSEQYHCELFDFGRCEKPCDKQCDSCYWMET